MRLPLDPDHQEIKPGDALYWDPERGVCTTTWVPHCTKVEVLAAQEPSQTVVRTRPGERMARPKSARTVTHERTPEADENGRHVGAPMNGAVAVEDEPHEQRPVPVAPPVPDIRNIAPGLLNPSPTNPRRAAGDLRELAESIRTKGILQPLLVRPVGDAGNQPGKKHYTHEIVFGHRRYLAAIDVGLQSVPCMVRDMNELEVLEAQIIENVQRLDVHPMDEAEGYERLMALGRTVEEIVAHTGKSKATIYARLKLLDLCKKARDLFLEGKIEASHALLAARIPGEALQREFLKEIGVWGERGVVSFREAREIAHRDFMLRLSEASFDVNDAELVPKAGACQTCPKRTGNQPALFADVKGADTCTDPACFKSKTDARWEQRAAEHKAAGGAVLSKSETAKVLPYANADATAQGSGYAALAKQNYQDPKFRTNGQLLGKAKKDVQITLARTKDGHVVELVDEKILNKKLRELGVIKPKPKQRSSGAKKKNAAKDGVNEDELMRATMKQAGNLVALSGLPEAITRTPSFQIFGRGLLAIALEVIGPFSPAVDDTMESVFGVVADQTEPGTKKKRRVGTRADTRIVLQQAVDESPHLATVAAVQLMLRHLADDLSYSHKPGEIGKEAVAIFKPWDVDLVALREIQRKEMKAKLDATAETKPAKEKKGKRSKAKKQ
jgi:ParB/RepB/Spo0J family partition protein